MLYRGRFAPSPSGALHAGSLVAALASWLDARAHQGQWLVEDIDTPRTVPGAADTILRQLAACGLHSDEPVAVQSTRTEPYRQALAHLVQQQRAYPCCCSRKAIALALQQQGVHRERHGEWVYPGTCRQGLPAAVHAKPGALAWRLRTDLCMQDMALAPVNIDSAATEFIAPSTLRWHDRRLGTQQQDVVTQVGDFVLQRADGCFTYQLAVVVDDAAQGITHVVRGEDLADNTARQIVLQRALSLPTPQYLHTPLVLDAHGEKLSKQTGAAAIETHEPGAALGALQAAAQCLGLPPAHATMASDALREWLAPWAQRWVAGAPRC